MRASSGNFNPRSHKGSDENYLPGAGQSEISIHAPTRGATTAAIRSDPGTGYFNPRSHKGSDPDAYHHAVYNLAFQSTLPQGERQREYV